MSVLQIDGLNVHFATAQGDVHAVRDFSLTLEDGECVGIVGESGAGKSQSLLAAMGLLAPGATTTGSVMFRGTQLLGADCGTLDRIRGADVGMIFQDPLTALTPHLTIGRQVAEPLIRHRGLARGDAQACAVELLTAVQMNDPQRRARQYPHELSGGMRQRAMIAMAIACEPALLIADEPTTALDVTIQAQIIRLLAQLKRQRGLSLVLVTHDLGVVAGIADRIIVMRSGRIVEQGTARSILKAPQSAHTRELLEAAPRIDTAQPLRRAAEGPARLQLDQLAVNYKTGNGWLRRHSVLRALDSIDLHVAAGEAVGIVGESGSGKSTLARAVLRLLRPASGRIVWLGHELAGMAQSALRPLRRGLQVVFQDPLASLDPRMTVAEIIAEPLRVHQPGLGREARIDAVRVMLGQVALAPGLLNRYPHELSGGQCQRVGIARAMILKPQLLVCDEAVSALDVTTQAQIVALMESLRREHGLSLLFISHDLAVVRRLCDRVLVLYLGRMMELGPADSIYGSPAHPYTRALLEAVPIADPDLQPARLAQALEGELPSPLAPPPGCVFSTRCPHAVDVCRRVVPVWEAAGEGRFVACHRWRDWPRTGG